MVIVIQHYVSGYKMFVLAILRKRMILLILVYFLMNAEREGFRNMLN